MVADPAATVTFIYSNSGKNYNAGFPKSPFVVGLSSNVLEICKILVLFHPEFGTQRPFVKCMAHVKEKEALQDVRKISYTVPKEKKNNIVKGISRTMKSWIVGVNSTKGATG